MRLLSLNKVSFLFTFFRLVYGSPFYPGKRITNSSDVQNSYDYVIVGGGLSGLVVANRLSEDARTTVLVIEAGPFDENEPWITIPLLSSGNIPSLGSGPRGSKYDWNLTGVSQPELGNRSVKTLAGKVIGGGTVLNGEVFNRGSKNGYDRWEELGNPGWDFDSFFPYMKKAETFTPPSAEIALWDIEYNPEYHGEQGHVHSSYPHFIWPSTRNFMESMKELGIPYIKDSMGGDAAGAFWFLQSLNSDDESRSTSQGFLVPRLNLHVLTGNIVTRVLFDAGTATGVEFSEGEGLERNSVSVSKEVILSAGALHTPQILQLSGIGDVGLLCSLGIDVVEDLPGVGENYQDHLLLFTGQTVNIAVSSANFTNATWSNEMLELYETSREGPFTTVGGNFFAFLPLSTFSNSTAFISEASAQQPAQYLLPNTDPTIISGYAAQHALLTKELSSNSAANLEFIFGDTSIIPGLQKPFSRGRVSINSTSPFASPVINPRYLSNPLDISSLIAGFKFARTIRNSSALQAIDVLETDPGEGVQTDEQIEGFIREGVDTLHHHGGTASMLPRELGGVVDSSLKVYGVRGLRVVDASVVPMLPAAHCQATIYGVAEKAADLIKTGVLKA